MKGTLHRTIKEWVVKYFDSEKAYDIMYCGESLPLHPEDANIVVLGMDNMEIEFEIVNESWDGYMGGTYAKLINHIVDNNEMVEDDVDEAEKEFIKLINGKTLPTKQLTEVAEHYFIVGYQEGKDKAKENLYTEEQLKIVYTKGYDRGIDRKPRNMEAYIEFIKQNKK